MTRFEVWKRKMNRKPIQQTGITLSDMSNALKRQISEAIEKHKNDQPSASQIVMARSESYMM